MSQHRKTPYISVSITPEAAAALRRMAVMISGSVDQRVNQSQAILIAEKMIFMHDQSITEAAKVVIELSEADSEPLGQRTK